MTLDVAANRPAFTAAAALQLAAAHYGRRYELATPLPSDRDQNFLLRGGDLDPAVLKIAGAAEDEAVLDLQNRALLHLARHEDIRLFISTLIPTQHGAIMIRVRGANGRFHFLRLLSYLPGLPLAVAQPHTPDLLWQSGRLLGQVDAILRDFRHPAAGRHLHWDLEHAPVTIRRYAPAISDPRQRTLVALFLDRFQADIAPHLGALRRGVIHSDGNDHNLLVSPAGQRPRRIVGLIDFGDMVHSPLLFEAAIAAAYLMLDKPDPVGTAAQVVAGFHSVMPLTETEVDLLPAAIAIRLSISVCLSAHQKAQEPHNAYLAVSEAPAWRLLARLAAVPPPQFRAVLRAACGFDPYSAS